MIDEISHIYHSSRLSTIDKAKRYTKDIELMYRALLDAEDKIAELQNLISGRSGDNSAETLEDILNVLQERGYTRRFTPSAPSGSEKIGGLR